jgi:cytochrome c-type biogenesis protein CcmF
MAVAPLLGWRRSDPHSLWDRMRPLAWIALALTTALLIAGVHKPLVLGAYLLASLAAGAAVRSIWLSGRAAKQRGQRRWRGLLAPSAGGMVVHLGVVLLAVGIVTSTSFAVRREVVLRPGQSTVVDGQSITFQHVQQFSSPLRYGTELLVKVNGTTLLYPAVTTYRGRVGQTVGTPAIDSNLLRDVYLTFDAYGVPGGTSGAQVDGALKPGDAAVGVTVEPLLSWLWIGGLVVGVGSALTIWRRPRRTEESA